MAWEFVGSFAQGISIAVQGMFAPQTVLAMTQSQNEGAKIAAQFQLERERQEFQIASQIDQQQFQAAMEAVRQKYNQEVEAYRQYREDVRLQKRLDSEREQLTRRFQHEQQLEQYRRETQILLSQLQLTSTLMVADRQEIREKFPLKTPADVILTFYNQFQGSDRPIPLLVIISPPGLEFEKFPNAANGFSRIESRLVDGIGEFCKHYPVKDAKRPIKYQGADWNSKISHGQSAIDILHHVFKPIPSVILESKVDGDLLKISVGGWDMMEEIPHYQKVLTIPWKEVLYPIARKYAEQWREDRLKLLESGTDFDELKDEGGDDELNLLILEKEERHQELGLSTKRDYSYKVNEDKYIQELSDVLEICHCVLVGIVADRYHFSHADVRPKLPELLPELLKRIPSADLQHLLLEQIVSSYESLYQVIEQERSQIVPDLLLDLALSFSHLSDPSWAKRQIEQSLKCWLTLRKIEASESWQNLLAKVEAVSLIADTDYIKKLNRCLMEIGESRCLKVLQACYNRGVCQYYRGEYQSAIASFDYVIYVNPQWQKAHYHRGLAYAQLDQYQSAIENYSQALKLNEKRAEVYNNRADAYYKLGQYEAAIADYDAALNLDPKNGSARYNRDLVWGEWQEIIGNVSFVHTLIEHSGEVMSLTISPDGQTLVSGDSHGTIKVWQLSTGQKLRTLTTHSLDVHPCVYSLAISPDGQTLVSGSHAIIEIWQLNTGELLSSLTGHNCYVNCLAISPDGQTLVSGSADTTIKVWQLNTGHLLRTLTGHSSSVDSLAISPDGQTLVSGSSDDTIKVWQLSTGQEVRTLTEHDSWIDSLAISPDGQTLVSGGWDKTIKVWRLNTGKLLHTLTGHSDRVSSLAISPNGQTLVSGSSDDTIKVWQLNTKQEPFTLTRHSNGINSLAISPDGKTLASGSSDKTIKIWQVQ